MKLAKNHSKPSDLMTPSIKVDSKDKVLTNFKNCFEYCRVVTCDKIIKAMIYPFRMCEKRNMTYAPWFLISVDSFSIYRVFIKKLEMYHSVDLYKLFETLLSILA